MIRKISMKTLPVPILLSFLSAGCSEPDAAGGAKPVWIESLSDRLFPELPVLGREIAALEKEITRLPSPAAANSTGSTGFTTVGTTEMEDLWVELDLGREEPVDRVVLIPTLLRGADGDIPGYGFPIRFLLAGYDSEGKRVTLMDQTKADFPNPGQFPVAVRCPVGSKLKGLRLTATVPWSCGGPYVLSLSEIMLLRGNLNVAARAEVTSVSSREYLMTWSRHRLIDMVTPLGLPVGSEVPGQIGWHSLPSEKGFVRKSFTVDLGRSWPLEMVRLVPCYRPGFQSQNQYGFPSRFFVEISDDPDFSKSRRIGDFTNAPRPTPGQNLTEFPAGGTAARYVRMTATQLRNRNEDFAFAMAEVQAYSDGENRALGAKVIAEESLDEPGWSRAALTDGYSSTGNLLELPQWIDGLERARQLIARRDIAVELRAKLHARAERTIVGTSVGGGSGMALLALGMAWRNQRRRRADREELRERLARDLHDELGSNLGSIALIASFADQADAGEMRADLAKIEKVARESADSMRDMVSLLSGKGGGDRSDWLHVIAESAKRTVLNAELELHICHDLIPRDPNIEVRREIYLFCKEVLHNAQRHSSAKHVSLGISPTLGGIRIAITDDGRGYDPTSADGGYGLGNLRERAAIMKGRISIQSAPDEGTTVILEIPRNRRWTERPKTNRP